jgi:methylase of polypeptide subunit release factors
MDSSYQELLNMEKKKKRSCIHSFHRYFGKLIPAIPAFAVKNFTREGDWVCDPFAGSGTTLVEAILNNRNALGFEINPVSCLISKAKTTAIDTLILKEMNEMLLQHIRTDSCPVSAEEIPYCVNRDHWFKDFVQADLVRINRNINAFFSKHHTGLSDEEQINITNFFRLVLSSIIRNVSNADTQHVFPGYSKRLRKLDAEGKRKIKVFNSFKNALAKKTLGLREYDSVNPKTRVIIENGDSRFLVPERYPKAALIVTNPPYISSIRYIETMKLELYWMEYIFSGEDYMSLQKKMIGNDRLRREDYAKPVITQYEKINSILEHVYALDAKSGNVVARYFNEMTDVIHNMNRILEVGGHVVMKISDSKVKKIKIETGLFLTEIARFFGFKLVDSFIDKIENRSLLTARNSYSDIITHDYIVIWQKAGELGEL